MQMGTEKECNMTCIIIKDQTGLGLKGWLDHEGYEFTRNIYHLTDEVLSNRYIRHGLTCTSYFNL